VVGVIGLRPRQSVDVDAEGDGRPLAALEHGERARVAALESSLEDGLVGPCISSAFVPVSEVGVVRDSHPMLARGPGTDVEFGEVAPSRDSSSATIRAVV